MSVRSRSWIFALGLALGACQLADAAAPETASILTRDECAAVPGYTAFRARLEQVVAARDGTALRALFHPDGGMRVNGIGGHVSTPDWGFDRPHAATVWAELEQILDLGCVRDGDRLLLPAMAILAEDGSVVPEQDMAIERFALRAAPDAEAPVVRWVDPGELVTVISSGEPEGWARLQIGGHEGYGPFDTLRSPHGFQLVLVPFNGGWRIREFTGGV